MLAKFKSFSKERQNSKNVKFEPSTLENESGKSQKQKNVVAVSPPLKGKKSEAPTTLPGCVVPKFVDGYRRATLSVHKNTTSNVASGMEVGVASYPQGPVARGSPDNSARSSPRSNLHVGFAPVGEMKERKEKYLTAKYGAHQMSLIRKRLGVEMWMYDQLQILYQNPKEEKSQEKEVDLDELLDMEEDSSRRKFLQKKLSDCKQSPDKLEKFINELLDRAKTL